MITAPVNLQQPGRLPEPSRDHWAVLAFTRFVLASIVVNDHCGLAIPPGPPWPSLFLAGHVFGPLAAILGFLMISGFSIAHSHGSRPDGFVLRRVSRIAPALAAVLLGYTAMLLIWSPIRTTSGATAYTPYFADVFFTLIGLNGFVIGSFLGPTWSLSAELFFYWLTPLFARLRPIWLAAPIIVSAGLYRWHDALGIRQFPGALYGLAAASLFWCWGLGFVSARKPGLWITILGACLAVDQILHMNYEGGHLAWLTILATWLAVTQGGRIAIVSAGWRRLMNYLGDISYPLYLAHYPVIVGLNGLLGVHNEFVLAGCSLLISAGIFHLVEKPLRRWIMAAFQQRSGESSPSSSPWPAALSLRSRPRPPS